MAKQTINIGTAPNDGTGDTARDAFDICNDNFTELYDGKLALDGSTEMTGDLVFAEAADHSSTPAAGKGYLWVKSDTPSSLIFTDDAGTDYDLTDITSTPEGTAILSTGETGGTKFLREDGDGTCSWQEVAGGGAFSADAQTQITPTTAIVLDEATGDEVALDLSATINKATSGNYSLIYADVTETAAPGTDDYLIDLKVGGTRAFGVTAESTGQTITSGADEFILTANNTTTAYIWAGTGGAGGSLYLGGSGKVLTTVGMATGYSGTTLRQSVPFGWASGTAINSGPDVTLYRDAANTLALRNSTNAQTFNVYNTYTDASNYERGFMKWNSDVLEIGAEAAGTGTARNLRLISSSAVTEYGGTTTSETHKFYSSSGGAVQIEHWKGGTRNQLLAFNNAGGMLFRHENDISAGNVYTFYSGAGDELTDTDAEQAFMYIAPKINQSGTAGYTGIKLDVTETATGSGTNRLLDLQVASTTKFAVENDGTPVMGTHSAIGAETVTGYITIKDAGGTTRKLAVVS